MMNEENSKHGKLIFSFIAFIVGIVILTVVVLLIIFAAGYVAYKMSEVGPSGATKTNSLTIPSSTNILTHTNRIQETNIVFVYTTNVVTIKQTNN